MAEVRNLLALPLSYLNKVGILRTKKIPKILFLIITIQIVLSIFSQVSLCLQFLYMDNNIDHYVENGEGIIYYLEFLGKLFSCLYYKNNFLNLIKFTTEHFWTNTECSAIVKHSTKKLWERTIFLQKIIMNTCVAVVICALMKSVMATELVTGYWTMARDNFFIIVRIAIITSVPLMTPFIGLFDCLYLGFCYEGIIQCKMLYDYLERISVKEINCENDLKNYCGKIQTCIKHHVILLRYHTELKKLYSFPLSVVYVVCASFICLEMYAISELYSLNSLVVYGTYLISVLIQLWFYCTPANYFTDELSSISTAVYNSDWYSRHFKISRTPNLLLIQRAQQKATLKAFGMIDMDNETLVKLFRFGMSASLTLRGLKKN